MAKIHEYMHSVLRKIYFSDFFQFFFRIYLELFFPLGILSVYQVREKKIRIGKNHDGGYVIVDAPPYDLLIGCGISNDTSFEEEFIKRFDVDCFAFDGTINELPGKSHRIKFIKKNISCKNTKKETNLYELIDNKKDIFLKMDIEGGEYSWLYSLNTDQLSKFKQIVVEFHAPFLKRRWNCLEKILKTHYLCHLHPNNRCGTISISGTFVPHVFECTFIRKRDILYVPILTNQSIPSHLDMKNDPGKDDIFLQGFPYTSIE